MAYCILPVLAVRALSDPNSQYCVLEVASPCSIAPRKYLRCSCRYTSYPEYQGSIESIYLISPSVASSRSMRVLTAKQSTAHNGDNIRSQHISPEYCPYWQYPPKLSVSNPEILGVQAVQTYRIRNTASMLAVWAVLNNGILAVLAV